MLSHFQTSTTHNPNVLGKIMNAQGSRKPFTYTPGGIDLSQIRKSARVKRYIQLDRLF